MIENSVAYHSGEWVPLSDLSISIQDLGFRQAVTVVERLRTYGGKPWQVARHLDRMQRTCLDLKISFERAIWHQRLTHLIERNAAATRDKDVGIVLLVTPGQSSSSLGTTATEMLHLSPLDDARVRSRRSEGQSVVVTNVQQPSPQSWPRHWKVRCRLHYHLADQFASQIETGSTGMLVDEDGSVTESGIASIAIVRHQEIFVPPPSRVLPSISAAVVESIIAKQGWSIVQTPITPNALIEADEVWLMGTDTGIWFADRIWCDGAWHAKQKTPPAMYAAALDTFVELGGGDADASAGGSDH